MAISEDAQGKVHASRAEQRVGERTSERAIEPASERENGLEAVLRTMRSGHTVSSSPLSRCSLATAAE